MFKRFAFCLSAVVLVIYSALCAASDTEGMYKLVKQQIPMSDGKTVHVQEFFWYSCPHCYELQTSVSDWYHSIPYKNVELELVPPAINVYWKKMAELYYTLKEMHKIEMMHMKIFDALQKKQLNLYDEDVLKKFLVDQGIDWKTYTETKESFAVQTELKRSENLANSYGIDGVPVFVVQGKYMTSMVETHGETQLFIALNKLIERVKKEEHLS